MVSIEHLYQTQIEQISSTEFLIKMFDFNNNMLGFSQACVYNISSDNAKLKEIYEDGSGSGNYVILNSSINQNTYSINRRHAHGYKLVISDLGTGLITIKVNEAIYQFYNDSTSTGNLSFDTSVFALWSSEIPFQYVRDGKLVRITGVLETKTSFTADGYATRKTICSSIPAEIRPSQDIVKLHHGSGVNKFMTRVETDGKITMERFGTSATNMATTAKTSSKRGTWLPINIEYLID